MKSLAVDYSRGQLKIQQMAFVLVALMILFGIVIIFYVSIKTASLKSSAEDIGDLRSRELARKLAGSPEFIYPSGECAACIDFDKVFVLKEKAQSGEYSSFWASPLIQVRKLGYGEDCNRQNYPNCGVITLSNTSDDFSSVSSFVTLCHYDSAINAERCELGKIVLGVKRQ
ncbi:MAG: hypothetical protein AABW79_04660 [Nanoarchaeota archaeon]